MSTLSVDPIRALIWRTLLFKAGGWTTQGLSDYTRRPRSTIIRKCRELQAASIIERRADGWHMTLFGRDACTQLFRETMHIALGERQGYSPTLIEKSARISPVHGDAGSIGFYPPLPRRASKVDMDES